ncbi:MAG: AsmA family protein, partial [Limisphaerales bacterium]
MPEPMFIVAPPQKPPQKRRRGWLRILAWLVVLLLLLMVVAYFVVTSPACLKNVVLPRLGDAIHANVSVSSIVFSPSRQIVLRDLKVQANGQAPVLTVPELNVRYHLWDMLGGNLHVDEIALVSPTVELVENPDGSSNLDPLLRALSGKSAAVGTSKPAKPSKPLQIDLGQLTLSKATIVKIKNYAAGRSDQVEITNLDITLSNVKNGQSAALQLSATVRLENNPPNGKSGSLTAAIKSDFHVALAADLKPASALGGAQLDVSSADGVFQDFSSFSAALNCDTTPAEIKQASLHFQKGSESLGEVDARGPLDMEKTEGRLQVKLQGVDKRLLNLAGAASGIDFGTTTINSTNEITLAKAGSVITATGGFHVDKFQLTRAGLMTPTLDFNANYDVTVDRTTQNALLQELTLAGTQNGHPLLAAQLTRPMNISWGTGTNEVGESALNVALTNLNLADWKPFLGGNAPAGNVNLEAQLLSQQNGGKLTFNVNSQIANLTANSGGSPTVPVTVSLQARGQAVDFKQCNLNEYRLQITRQNQQLLAVNGSGTYDLADGNADAQVALQASLAGLADAFPQSGSSVSSGSIELTGHLTQQKGTQTLTGHLILADFSGQTGKNSFRDFGSTMDVNVSRTPEQVQINKLTGALTQNGNAGGNFDLSGLYDSARRT